MNLKLLVYTSTVCVLQEASVLVICINFHIAYLISNLTRVIQSNSQQTGLFFQSLEDQT